MRTTSSTLPGSAGSTASDHRRRQDLLRLVCRHFCANNGAELARRINKNASYVNRCFYPPEKPGYKGIGLVLTDAVSETFSLPDGFWGMTLAQAEAALDGPSQPPVPHRTAPSPRVDMAAVQSPIARALIEKLTTVAAAGLLPERLAVEWLGELVKLEA